MDGDSLERCSVLDDQKEEPDAHLDRVGGPGGPRAVRGAGAVSQVDERLCPGAAAGDGPEEAAGGVPGTGQGRLGQVDEGGQFGEGGATLADRSLRLYPCGYGHGAGTATRSRLRD